MSAVDKGGKYVIVWLVLSVFFQLGVSVARHLGPDMASNVAFAGMFVGAFVIFLTGLLLDIALDKVREIARKEAKSIDDGLP